MTDEGILLSKMALEQLQTWQDYSNNTLYVKQTAIPLHDKSILTAAEKERLIKLQCLKTQQPSV